MSRYPSRKRKGKGINEQNICGVSVFKKKKKNLNITYSKTPRRDSYMVLSNQN
jgi:hypothetical protein